jgi:hypothetical protein
MRVLAIDPGYQVSAAVLYDGERVVHHTIEANAVLLSCAWGPVNVVVLEQIESFGMAVGREVFETVFWTGRLFEQADVLAARVVRMPRRAVKLHLCGSSRATDANIRVALVDRFGGSKAAAVGTKRAPGPLYGIKSHEWAALALAVTYHDQHATTAPPPPAPDRSSRHGVAR